MCIDQSNHSNIKFNFRPKYNMGWLENVNNHDLRNHQTNPFYTRHNIIKLMT